MLPRADLHCIIFFKCMFHFPENALSHRLRWIKKLKWEMRTKLERIVESMQERLDLEKKKRGGVEFVLMRCVLLNSRRRRYSMEIACVLRRLPHFPIP